MTHHEKHTTDAALQRGELTEEEAYFVLRFAGRAGYRRAMRALTSAVAITGPLHNLRRRLLWIGGWEHAKLRQWDEGLPPIEPVRRGRLVDPYPLTIGPVTFYGWGWQVELRRTYLVVLHNPREVYLSPNATPHHRDVRWIVGPVRPKNKIREAA